MSIGKISKIISDRGFAFIMAEGSTMTFFFHANNVLKGNFAELVEGQQVEYTLGRDKKSGREQALDVMIEPDEDTGE